MKLRNQTGDPDRGKYRGILIETLSQRWELGWFVVLTQNFEIWNFWSLVYPSYTNSFICVFLALPAHLRQTLVGERYMTMSWRINRGKGDIY